MPGRVDRRLLLATGVILLGAGCRAEKPPFALPTTAPPAPVVEAPATSASPLAVRNLPVTVYLVAMNSSPAWEKAAVVPGTSLVGCEDYVVPVTATVEGNPLSPLRNALTKLLAISFREAEALGYATALTNSTLSVGDIVRRPDGTFQIDLVGKLMSAGTCDDPRIRAQIERTAAQFGNFEIRVNGSEATWRCFGDESGECR